MSESEIRTSYRQAKDQREQIEILADLNDCKPQEIAALLGVAYKKRGARIEWTQEMIAVLRNMARRGYGDRKIAETLEISPYAVHKKRTSLKIKKGEKYA